MRKKILIGLLLCFSTLMIPYRLASATNLKQITDNRQTEAAIIVDEAYLEHDVLTNGDLLVNEQVELTINADTNSLVFYFAYSKPIDLSVRSVTLSIDSGDGFSIPVQVPAKSSLSNDLQQNNSSPQPYYQMVRSSNQESIHIVNSFGKGQKIRLSMNYELIHAADRYADLGLMRRFLVSDELSYPVTHLEAVYRFPDAVNGTNLAFQIFPLYRWQNPVEHQYFMSNQEVHIELRNVASNARFEFVIGFPADVFPDIPLTEDINIEDQLKAEVAEIRQNQAAIGRVSSWLQRNLIRLVVLLFLIAVFVILTIQTLDISLGRRNREGRFFPNPPRGISPSGLNFLLSRKVIGQDIFAIMIKLCSLGLIQYDKNLFTLPVGVDTMPAPHFDELAGNWVVYGQKGAVRIDASQYIIYKSLVDIGGELDAFSPAALQKMSKTKEYSTLYYRVITDYAKSIKDDLQQRGLFDKHMKRGIFLAILILMYVLTAVITFIFTWHWMSWLILLPAVMLALLAQNIRTLSREGHWTLHHTVRFKYYLTHFSELSRTKQPADDVLVDLLVYAIAFGCEADFIDELYKARTNDELISISFYRQSGLGDLLRSSLASAEGQRQTNLASRIKQRYREGRVDLIAVVFNSKHFYKL